MWKRFMAIGCALLLVMASAGGKGTSAMSGTMEPGYMSGKVFLNQFQLPDDAVLFTDPLGAVFSLRIFFEAIGAQVNYDKDTGNTQITHLNQELLVTKCVISLGDILLIEKIKNPSGIEFGILENNLQLNPMGDDGIYTVINGRIYLTGQDFTYMLGSLGYSIEIDREARTANITPITLNNIENYIWTEGNEDYVWIEGIEASITLIDGELFLTYPLSDGSWYGRIMRYAEYDAANKRQILVDAVGRVYELTDITVDGSAASAK